MRSPSYSSREREKEFCQQLADIHTLCFFVGHGRSGHSLVGHLLNQHPNIAIADEYSLFTQNWISELNHNLHQMFLLAQKTKNRDFIGGGGYPLYKLNTEYSGSQSIQVLGDNSAGLNTRLIRTSAIEKGRGVKIIEDYTQKILKFIFVIRNPYDIISTMSLREVFVRSPLYQEEEGCSITQVADRLGAEPQYYARVSKMLPRAISAFFTNMRVVQGLTEHYGQALISIHHHEFTAEPRQQLRKLLKFLNVEEPTGYLDEAVKQVRPSTRSRELINHCWNDSVRAEVAEQMRLFDFFANYSFESD